MTNRSASSGQAWVAIANVDVTDGKTADVELSADKPLSYSLRVSGFAFGVPAGARIRGVHVRLRVQQTGTADIVDEAVTLFVGSQLLSDSQDRGEPLPPSYATVTYGGDDQMWGLDANTLTPAAVNSPSFGVSYQVKKATSGSASAHVDEISVEVHYCE